MKERRIGGWPAMAVFLLLSACGTVDPPGRPPTFPAPRPEAPVGSREVSPAETEAAFHREITNLLQTGEYGAALLLLRREVARGREEESLVSEYGRTLNGLLEKADLLQDQGMPGRAGPLYRRALDGFPRAEAVAALVNLSPAEIRDRLAESAKALMERGLIAYRAGNLDAAIREWKTIQAFDPSHEASLKALETAEIQRDNLEKVRAR